MILLALDFPPLMAVMIAIAALDRGTSHHDQVAIESYLFSLRDLQDRMRHASDAGNPDGLLATTICMCVFEVCLYTFLFDSIKLIPIQNSRSDVPPNIGVHATMAGVLLNLRRPNSVQDPIQTVTAFERVCAESFVYHSTLLMLFDPSLDVLCHVNPDMNWARFFSDFPDGDADQSNMSTTTQPVLDASYKFFLVVADVTRIARIPRPLNDNEVETWGRLQTNLTQWEEAVRGDASRLLYILALRILLLKIDPRTPVLECTKQMDSFLRRGLFIMNGLDVRKFLLGYLLWPLAVLGTVAVDESDRHIIEGQISLLAQTGHGQAVRVKRLMETIWNSKDGEKPTMMLQRLRMLVEGF